MEIYSYDKCSTCRKALKYLDEHKIKYVKHSIITETPSAEMLQSLIEANNLPLTKVFNTSGKKYRELGLKNKVKDMSIAEASKLLASDGMLIKRPIIIEGDKVLFGFKEAEVAKLNE